MIRIEIELSAPDMRTLDAAAWVATALNAELPLHAVIHRISAEEDA